MADWQGMAHPKVKHVSAKEFREELAKSEKRGKYGNKRSKAHGMSFDSGLERVFLENYLMPLQLAGEIREIQREPGVTLEIMGERWKCKPDFSAFDKKLGETVYYECKGQATLRTDRFRNLRKHWRIAGPGRLRVYLGSKKGYRLYEEIVPKGATANATGVPVVLNGNHAGEGPEGKL